MLRASVALSVLAYDVLWQHHGLDEKPNALHTPSPGATEEERAVLEHQAWQELDRSGLVHNGRIDEDLVEALSLLARPAEEVYAWVNQTEGPDYTVLAALRGGDAVLAVLTREELRLHPVRPTALVETLVSALPDVPAARGRSLSTPADQLSQPPADPDNWLEEVRPIDSDGNGQAHNVLALPRTGGGQLHVAVRDRLGQRRRAPHPVTFIDTTEGRWLTQLRPDPHRQPWVVLTPADSRLLTARLHEMRAELTRA
ncbi:ESX secretion-associated protein EspG [Streptoalloteichus hindustanus]|uniref:EspG family protein n=1 Tax=Streptoalloteichus hindustanus TaxID=2017 RepID=A0A1M5L7K1_STRHI|nr:ESX secretion-associated protein EspG [Streptoalloteichus hindustanus]SHG61082.1 EspG family protein [Streptoalloteichus hindustanus]